jgi:hypothetical protein
MSDCQRNNAQERTKHHRKPRSLGGTNSKANISIVPRNKHEAWHLLFSNLTPEQIAEVMNYFWVDPDYFMVAIPKRGVDHVKR